MDRQMAAWWWHLGFGAARLKFYLDVTGGRLSPSESWCPSEGAAAHCRGAPRDLNSCAGRGPRAGGAPWHCPGPGWRRLTFPVSLCQPTRTRPLAACGYPCGRWMGRACLKPTPWTPEEPSLRPPPHPPRPPPRPQHPPRPHSPGPPGPRRPPRRHRSPPGSPQGLRPRTWNGGCWTRNGSRAPCSAPGPSSRVP